jgi:hypothetical protein
VVGGPRKQQEEGERDGCRGRKRGGGEELSPGVHRHPTPPSAQDPIWRRLDEELRGGWARRDNEEPR